MTTNTLWGDPGTESFRRKHIREVRLEGSKAHVNKEISAIVSRLLEDLSHLHQEFDEAIVSYDPEGTEHQRIGLALRLPLAPIPEIEEALHYWMFDGFVVDDGGMPEIRFMGTPEDAERLVDVALTKHQDALERDDVGGPSAFQFPGRRDLPIGTTGADVLFLHYLFGSPSPSNVVDEWLVEAVKRFQQRRGAKQTGVIDEEFWGRMFGQKRPHISAGENGFWIRVLQAGILAQDLGTTAVTGYYGHLTGIDVRKIQREHGFRIGAFARDPEWAIVLGPRWEPYAPAVAPADEAGTQTPPGAPVDVPAATTARKATTSKTKSPVT